MNFHSVYFLLVALGFFIAGAIEIWKKKCFTLSKKQYTEESLRRFSLYDGMTEILFGVAVISLRLEPYGRKLCLVVLIGAMLLFTTQFSRIVEKKQSH